MVLGRACPLAGAVKCLTTGARKGEFVSALRLRSGIFAHLASNDATFPLRKRLSTSREFARVFADPQRSSDQFFTVLACKGESTVPRLGLTISRRVAKRAVDRNRLKRIAREAFRQQRGLPPVDFVVMAKVGAALAAKVVLNTSLNGHFASLTRRIDARKDG